MIGRGGWLAVALLGTAACAGILGLRETKRRPFEHRAHVLEGIPCVRCHEGIPWAGDTGPLHLPDDASCLPDCHEKPHDERSCLGCHTTAYAAADAMQAREHLVFAHERHYGPLKGNCVRCHVGVAQDSHRLRPTMSVCLGCHEHKDQFEVRDCQGCHVDLPSEMTRPESHLVHDGDFVREHGVRAASSGDLCQTCHRERFCASCHGAAVPALPSRMYFDRPNAAGMHRAGFRARHGDEARAEPGICTSCHTESSCQSCHADQGIAASAVLEGGSPHPADWVGLTGANNRHGREARRDPASCASCHGGAGEALCVSCHAVGGVGGNPHPPGWSSTRSKAKVPCRLCHIGGR